MGAVDGRFIGQWLRITPQIYHTYHDLDRLVSHLSLGEVVQDLHATD